MTQYELYQSWKNLAFKITDITSFIQNDFSKDPSHKVPSEDVIACEDYINLLEKSIAELKGETLALLRANEESE